MTSRCSMWSCSISCPSTTLRSHLFIPSHDSLLGTSDSEFSYHWFVGRLADYALAAQILLLSATSNRYQLRLIHRHLLLVPQQLPLGFISGQSGDDVFVHFSAVQSRPSRTVQCNERP